MREEQHEAPKSRVQDFTAIAMGGIGGLFTVSIVLWMREWTPREGVGLLFTPVTGLTGLIGAWPGLLLALSLAICGAVSFVSQRPRPLGRSLLALSAMAVGLSLAIGGLTPDGGGAIGAALPATLSGTLGLLVASLLGLVVFMTGGWVLIGGNLSLPISKPEVHSGGIPTDQGGITEGVSPAEALALLIPDRPPPAENVLDPATDIRSSGGVPPGASPLQPAHGLSFSEDDPYPGPGQEHAPELRPFPAAEPADADLAAGPGTPAGAGLGGDLSPIQASWQATPLEARPLETPGGGEADPEAPVIPVWEQETGLESPEVPASLPVSIGAEDLDEPAEQETDPAGWTAEAPPVEEAEVPVAEIPSDVEASEPFPESELEPRETGEDLEEPAAEPAIEVSDLDLDTVSPVGEPSWEQAALFAELEEADLEPSLAVTPAPEADSEPEEGKESEPEPEPEPEEDEGLFTAEQGEAATEELEEEEEEEEEEEDEEAVHAEGEEDEDEEYDEDDEDEEEEEYEYEESEAAQDDGEEEEEAEEVYAEDDEEDDEEAEEAEEDEEEYEYVEEGELDEDEDGEEYKEEEAAADELEEQSAESDIEEVAAADEASESDAEAEGEYVLTPPEPVVPGTKGAKGAKGSGTAKAETGGKTGKATGSGSDAAALSDADLLFQAGCLILEENRVAVSMIERKFDLSFDDACQVLDELQAIGLIGPYMGGRTRDILLGRDEWLAKAPAS